MGSIDVPADVTAALDAFDAAEAAVCELNRDMLGPAVRLHMLERMETARRRQIAWSHDVIAGLANEDPAHVGGPVHKVIADWLRISCAEARRRMAAIRATVTANDVSHWAQAFLARLDPTVLGSP